MKCVRNLQSIYILIEPARGWPRIIFLMQVAGGIPLTDELLASRIRNSRDRHELNDLFREFFERFRSRVTDWCCRIVRDPDYSADLAQEVFLRAFQRLDTFRGDARLSTWLYTITRNHCLNAIKRRSQQPCGGETATADLPGPDGMEIYHAIERTQAFYRLWRLMEQTLTPTELQVVSWHYAHSVPLAEITRKLVLSNPSGAKAYIVSARRKLNAALREEHGKRRRNHP